MKNQCAALRSRPGDQTSRPVARVKIARRPQTLLHRATAIAIHLSQLRGSEDIDAANFRATPQAMAIAFFCFSPNRTRHLTPQGLKPAVPNTFGTAQAVP
jgi:hypothetical protein